MKPKKGVVWRTGKELAGRMNPAPNQSVHQEPEPPSPGDHGLALPGDNYSIPLALQMIDGASVPTGSGWFLRIGAIWFLVTAEHVIGAAYLGTASPSSRSNDLDILVPGVTGIIRLSGKVRASKQYDVAVIRLNDPGEAGTRWTPVTVADLVPSDDPPGEGWFEVDGWPVQRAAWKGDSLHGKDFRFIGKFDSGTLRCDPETDIFIALDLNDHGTLDGEPEIAPALAGISGSPVWRIASRGSPRLAGVQRSCTRVGQVVYIRATRWSVVRPLVEDLEPGLLRTAEQLVRP